MKTYRKEIWLEVPSRKGVVNITRDVKTCVRESGIREGLCLVNAMNITSSVFINDDESGLHQDLEDWLEGLAPHEPVSSYHHNLTDEVNADAHLKEVGDGTGDGRRDNEWSARFWNLGADLLL